MYQVRASLPRVYCGTPLPYYYGTHYRPRSSIPTTLPRFALYCFPMSQLSVSLDTLAALPSDSHSNIILLFSLSTDSVSCSWSASPSWW